MTEMTKPFLIVIVGPTASGKTELSIEVAKNLTEKLLAEIQYRSIKAWILVQQKLQLKKWKVYHII